MNEGILSVIGKTPLVRLNKIFKHHPIRLFAKLESLNPGGSTKDRPAISIISRAVETGAVRSGDTVIESSSGNMGIALAQACNYFGLKFICVVDPKATLQNIRLIKAYGAEIDFVTEPDPETGEYLQARIDRVQALLRSIENSFWPDQYSNIYNPIAHHQTMREITTELGGDIDYLFCSTSTCGTMRGCAEYIRDYNLKTKKIAVDALGSVIFGSENAKRLIPGHGASVRPRLYQPDIADDYVLVTDLDCIIGCRELVRHEAILAGGSSGGVISAVKHRLPELEPGATCVVILPDRGERYLDTIYSEEWVMRHFGNTPSLWKEPVEANQCLAMTY